MSESECQPRHETQQPEGHAAPLVFHAEDLFQGQREICIEHNGQRYRLRITRRNKLILQK